MTWKWLVKVTSYYIEGAKMLTSSPADTLLGYLTYHRNKSR